MAIQSSPKKKVVIQENIPQAAISGLAEAIQRYYVTPNVQFIESSSFRRVDSGNSIDLFWLFKQSDDGTTVPLSVNLSITQPLVELRFEGLDTGNALQVKLSTRVTDDVQNIVWQYLQNTKLSSLYFVVGGHEDRSEAPGQQDTVLRSILRRLFRGNTANVFLSFLFLSFVLFIVIGIYTVFVLIILQLVYLIFSDRIAMNMGNVHPTAQKPLVTIVSVRSDRETLKSLSTFGKKILPEVREEVMKSVEIPTTLSDRIKVKTTVLEILSRHGIHTNVNDIEIKTRNVYAIVDRVSEQFHRSPPRIVIANSLVSNAAATGISATRSSIMITAGSLEDLPEEELEGVIGHELGHIKGHDPVILFAVTSFELFGRFFLWFPLFLSQPILYFIVAFGAIFAVGKVLETRADTESAIVLGRPQVLASALASIGMRQFYHEKYSPVAKIFDWFQFDPHPPIYFRINRLANFRGDWKNVKHAFLMSLRDCIVGFVSAFT